LKIIPKKRREKVEKKYKSPPGKLNTEKKSRGKVGEK